jgi:hypothetical protein
MRWWTKALLFSVIFSVIWDGSLDVFIAGQTTPAQDHTIGEKYGELARIGRGVGWVIGFLEF